MLPRFARLFACASALTISAPCAAGSMNVSLETTGTPPGFNELASSRETLVDVYFGNRKVVETLVDTKPGVLRFRSPQEVLAALPLVIAAPELVSALAAELPTNSQAACAYSNLGNCGNLSPPVIGIISDEAHFRVDLFVNPRFLRTLQSTDQGFLPTPSAPLSLTSALGVAASGSLGGHSLYNIQNRTVLAVRNARIRTSNSFASGLGWVVDDFVGEVDRKDLRYSAGLFWAPGNEFTGQRRIIGGGIGTQFDTSADRQTLEGTPLVLFLVRPARVELLVDGRLVSSRSYSAGNNELDTSALSDGSYSVLLRIQEENGSVREERRFFVKNAQVAPIGHPVYFLYGGLLANTRAHSPISVSDTFYYQAGAAWRLSNAIAFDVAALGTQRRAIVEAGGWFIEPFGRIRLAGLASTAGDAGALVQLASGGHGPINFNLDIRRIWSHNNQPLIPLPSYVDTFEAVPPSGVQLANGSYTQAIGSVGLRLEGGYFSLVGTYRKDRNAPADYSIGPSIDLPLLTEHGLQVVFQASAQRTRSSTLGFAGVRLLYTSGGLSMMSTVGRTIEDERGDSDRTETRSTGSIGAQYSHQTQGGSLLTTEVGADRNINSSTVRAGATMFSELGNARVDLLHNLEGQRSTQYDVSFQSGLALSSHSMTFGARQTDQSAIVISIAGDADKAVFKVLLDDTPRGEVRTGQPLSLFVPAYHTYRVRLLPIGAASVDYDAAAREITLYPGNVQSLEWKAQSYFTVFAQAVAPDGSVISNALVESKRAVAQTDASGYFQLDMRRDDEITIARDGAPTCVARLPSFSVKNDYASIGKVVCE